VLIYFSVEIPLLYVTMVSAAPDLWLPFQCMTVSVCCLVTKGVFVNAC